MLSADLLQPLLTAPEGAEKIEVEILTRTKDEAENKRLFERIIEIVGEGVSQCLGSVYSEPTLRTDDFIEQGRHAAQGQDGR